MNIEGLTEDQGKATAEALPNNKTITRQMMIDRVGQGTLRAIGGTTPDEGMMAAGMIEDEPSNGMSTAVNMSQDGYQPIGIFSFVTMKH